MINIVDPNVDLFTTSGGTSYATGSWTPPANALALLWVYSTGGLDFPLTVSGNGLTWDAFASDNNSSDRVLTGFLALTGSSPTTGTVTVTYGTNRTGQALIVCAFTGTLGTNGNATFIGTGTTGTVSFYGSNSPGILPVACFAHAANQLSTPRANWSEYADGNFNNPASGIEAQWRSDSNEDTATATWTTSSEYIAIGTSLVPVPTTGISWINSKGGWF